jgi:hypothetical protein
MGRELTSHKVNWLNEVLKVEAEDGPGPGGASHEYRVSIDETKHRPEAGWVALNISFQNGPVQEAGANGVSNEALLAIVEDRLLGFQSGQYACRENAIALTKLQEAMMWLQKRTLDRVRRGVEGTMEK